MVQCGKGKIEGLKKRVTEKIKIVLVKRNMKPAELARALNCAPSNLYQKFKRDNFSEKELKEIGEILNCDFIGTFKMRDTGEEI